MLDALDKAHEFALPRVAGRRRVRGHLGQLEQNLKAEGKTLADEGKSEEELRADYRKIAERRVRLGLVIGEIGEKNKHPGQPGRAAPGA